MAKKKDLKYDELTGKQKAAVLLMSMDVDVAAKIFQEFDMKEVEQIAVEITNLKELNPSVIESVIEEFYQLMTASNYLIEGGLEYAQMLLERSYGPEKARDIIEKIRVLTSVRGFTVLKKADPQQLANFLSKEHPQTIALILSHLPADQSAEVLGEFDEQLRSDTVIRIATLGKVSPSIVSEIEAVVDEIAETTLSQDLAKTGGTHMVASILNKSNNQVAKMILENIEEQDYAMATEIKRLMFLFEDIILIDDRSIQRILRDVEKSDLALALKASDQKVQEKIFKNMSQRASEVIREEIEFMGPVKLKEVESAQMRIVDIIKDLEDKEEIVVGGRGNEDVFV
jgi:flagellar motor switch protein FliG